MFRNSVWVCCDQTELLIEIYNKFEEEKQPQPESLKEIFTGMQVITAMYLRQTASKTRSIRKEDASL